MPDYLLRKSTGELEIVTGDAPLLVTPANGGGSYLVYQLTNAGNITIAGSGGGGGGGGNPFPGSPTIDADVVILQGIQGAVAPSPFEFGITFNSGATVPGPGADEVYDPRLHDYEYFWSISDDYTFNAPEHVAVPRSNANRRGPRIATLIRHVGTSTVNCLIVNRRTGDWGQTPDFSVTTLQETITGDNVIYVGSGTPPAGAATETSLESAVASLRWRGPDPKKILLDSNDTHTGRLDYGFQTTLPFTIIEPTGASATVNLTGNGFIGDVQGSTATHNLIHKNIIFDGGFNAVTGAGPIHKLLQVHTGSVGGFIVFDGCTIQNVGLGIETTGDIESGQKIFLNDCTLSGYQHSVYYQERGFAYAIGCRFMQTPGALGQWGNGDVWPIAPVRLPRPVGHIFSLNDFYVGNGWFENFTGYATTQPAFRALTSPLRGAFGCITDNTMEGGYSGIWYDSHASGETVQTQQVNLIVQGNFITLNAFGSAGIHFNHSGATVESNVVIHSNSNRILDPDAFVSFKPGPNGYASDYAAGLNRVVGNQFINLVSAANAAFSSVNIAEVYDQDSAYNVKVANNVVHQPNTASPVVVANLDATPLFDMRYEGYFDGDTALDPTTATPDDTPALYRPLAGAAILDSIPDGTTITDIDLPMLDFLYNWRSVDGAQTPGAFATAA